jgi:hypothetical protein
MTPRKRRRSERSTAKSSVPPTSPADAFAARASLLMESMMDATRKSCINIADLLRKYSRFCQQLTQDTDSRLKDWIACKAARCANIGKQLCPPSTIGPIAAGGVPRSK